MTDDSISTTPLPQPSPPDPAEPLKYAPADAVISGPLKSPRLGFPIVLLGLYWALYLTFRLADLGGSLGFKGWLIQLAACAILTIGTLVWWLVGRWPSWKERFAVVGVVILGGVASVALAHKSFEPFPLVFLSLPWVLTAAFVAILVARRWPAPPRPAALMAAVLLVWGVFPLLRMEGLGGDGQASLHWRWSQTAEDRYLAELKGSGVTPRPATVPAAAGATTAPTTLAAQPGDWPAFRGPDRDGVAHGVRLATDWAASPPRQVWRRRIGPAWSSVAVVGTRLFTQEQIGTAEAVTCLDTATGKTLWSHSDPVRHNDGQGGPGPRATPTFADGRIYALGATGLLNCLDAATGDRVWSRDIAADSGATRPIWGFSSSPLVAGPVVVVFAGGDSAKTLLAYQTATGQPAWTASAGKISYSSPQLATIAGVPQVLFDSDQGLAAYDPATGAVLWEDRTPAASPGVPRATQPRVIGSSRVLVDAGPDLGSILVEVAYANGKWSAARKWVSRDLKPSFNDFVVKDGAVYGFDGRVFTCVDLETGRRRWKDGRYGSGQVMLLGDQPTLLVAAESGEAVLVAAEPGQHRELARFQAIGGKTWNHPAVAHGRLFVRNAEEIACYELRPEGSGP